MSNKCFKCDRETKHPRGDKAIDEGWQVMEAKVNDEKIVLIGCPDHSGDEFAFECIKKIKEAEQRIRDKHRGKI